MQGIHLFTFKGIPVGLNPMFLVLVLILSINLGNIIEMIIFAVCAFIGILIHEFGHALVARHYGLGPAVVLHGFGGMTTHSPPVRPKEDFLITFAGPGAGLVVGLLFWGLTYLLSVLGLAPAIAQYPYLVLFIQYMTYINLIWSIFNLLPCRPMDGGKIMGHILRKFMSIPKAEMTGSVISVVFAGLILLYSIYIQSVYMILISAYFLLINLAGIREAFRAIEGKSNSQKRLVGIQAEAIYEKGRTAAREHDWKALEMYGHQMKKAAEGADQIERAYELLTIACTNLGKYEEALNHSAHARESDAVRQAIERCKAMLD